MIGAVDRIFGNRLRLGNEFEKGFMLLGNMSLSMIGMIVISPLIADLLAPVFGVIYDALHIDPSIIPASLFANDMGVMLNSAFAVSAAFTFAGHLAFTMAFDASYLLPMIVGKLAAGFLALALAFLLYSKLVKEA